MFIQIHNNIINSEQIVFVSLDKQSTMTGGHLYCLNIQLINSGLNIKGTEQEINDAFAKLLNNLVKE